MTKLAVAACPSVEQFQQEAPVPSDLIGLSAQATRGEVVRIDAQGFVHVALPGGRVRMCEVLQSVHPAGLTSGATVLLAPMPGAEAGVVLGCVRRLPQGVQTPMEMQADSSISLRCGEASLTLNADGRVLIKGEDVTVHAKGTQRIRAGTVAIN